MSSFIRPVDVTGSDMEVYAELVRSGLRAEWGVRAPQPPTDDFRVDAQSAGVDVRFYLLWLDDLAVGGAELRLTDFAAEEAAWAVVRVQPQLRGYGFGQQLVRHCEDVARSVGCRTLRCANSSISIRDDRNTRFIKRQGYHHLRTGLRQDLDLPHDVPDPDAAVGEDFEFFVFDDVPALSICEALAAVEAEATGEESTLARGFVQATSGQARQQMYARCRAGGREFRLALLRHRASGRVVGATEAQYMPGAGRAELYETFVVAEFSTVAAVAALQATALRALVADYPEIRGVRVFQRGQDEVHIEASRQLGFVDTAFNREWEKEL